MKNLHLAFFIFLVIITIPQLSIGQKHYGRNHGKMNHSKTYSPRHEFSMNNYEFNILREIIRNESFESSKLEIAKQAIRMNGVKSKQVRELMYELSFESSRLNLSKFAYKFTCDRNMYFIVYNAFTFESSKKELERYIFRSCNQ